MVQEFTKRKIPISNLIILNGGGILSFTYGKDTHKINILSKKGLLSDKEIKQKITKYYKKHYKTVQIKYKMYQKVQKHFCKNMLLHFFVSLHFLHFSF